MNAKDIKNMINEIGILNIDLLFSLKMVDLLAQSSEYHHLLLNIDKQEHDITKTRKKEV